MKLKPAVGLAPGRLDVSWLTVNARLLTEEPTAEADKTGPKVAHVDYVFAIFSPLPAVFDKQRQGHQEEGAHLVIPVVCLVVVVPVPVAKRLHAEEADDRHDTAEHLANVRPRLYAIEVLEE